MPDLKIIPPCLQMSREDQGEILLQEDKFERKNQALPRSRCVFQKYVDLINLFETVAFIWR